MVDAFPPSLGKRATGATATTTAVASTTPSITNTTTSTSSSTERSRRSSSLGLSGEVGSGSVGGGGGSTIEKRRLVSMGGNEIFGYEYVPQMKKKKLEYGTVVNSLSGPVKDALNRFREISEMELERLRKEGFDLPTSVHKLVDKMRTNSDMQPSFTRKEIETVMELSGFNEEGARRALILKQEISKLKKEGFNHPEAIDELSRRMKRLSGLKRRSSPLSLSGFMMMMDTKRFKLDPSLRNSRKRHHHSTSLGDHEHDEGDQQYHLEEEEEGGDENEELILSNAKKKMKTYDFVSSESSEEGDNATGSSDDGSNVGSRGGNGAAFPFSFSVPFEEVEVVHHHHHHHDELMLDGFSADKLDEGDGEDGDEEDGDEESLLSGEDFDGDGEEEEEDNPPFPKDEDVWHFGNPLLKSTSSKKRRDSISRHSRQHNHSIS